MELSLLSIIMLLFVGAITSYMTGLVGAVSGTLYIPFLLIALPMLEPSRTVGTARAMSVLSTLAALVVFLFIEFFHTNHAETSYFYWPAIFAFIIPALPFIHLGARHAYSLPIRSIKKGYAIFVTMNAFWLLGYSAL